MPLVPENSRGLVLQGDILVFLPGQDEIESLEKVLTDLADTFVCDF